ncbi:UPF0158 family protein [Bacillaceae bacterium S4-13-56]
MSAKVKLSVLIDEIENDFDEYQSFVNLETGGVVMVSDWSLSKAEDEEPPEDMDSLDEELRIAYDIVDSVDKYISLPDRFEINEYQMMEDFCFSLEDRKQKDILLRAINGKGAFRRFKDRAFELGVIEDWYEYKRSCYRKIAIDFCKDHGLEYVE